MTFKTGSSPHTRGTPPVRSQPGPSRRDHPRIRGEHGRGRGAVQVAAGIIPVYAGNTSPDHSESNGKPGSSPHTRGTLAALAIAAGAFAGSSPHTRGTPRSAGTRTGGRGDHPRIRGEHCCLLASCINLTGIIPAYAGNTVPTIERETFIPGSSPHTRGTR